MRADDIPDIFISSQIIDENLAKERLIDLADYDFVNGLSTALLDRASIDGGVYALPVNNVIYGIYYNKTLMEEHGWELPANFAELEALCAEIKAAGLEPGYIGMQLTGVPFATVFNLAKTGFDAAGDGEAYPYVLVTRGGADLKDGETYRVAFTANSYTEEVG